MGKVQARVGRELTVYVRQLAWLHATPKPDEATKRAKAANQPERLSRLDQLKKDGITPKMPPNPAPHIVARLVELGMTGSTGMGPAPLSWLEDRKSVV